MRLIFLLLLSLVSFLSLAQEAQDYKIITDIQLQGLEKTKAFIVLRELDFQVGDTLQKSSLQNRLNQNQNHIYNTFLFESVKVSLADSAEEAVKVQIDLQERWYTFLFPVFELADRNFNEWWVDYEHDLERTIYGLRFLQSNCRGRNESFYVLAHLGFTKKIDLRYEIPYIDRKHQWGLTPRIQYILNRSIAYQTKKNKLQFYEHPTVVRKRIRVGATLKRRPKIYQSSFWDLSFYQNQVADTIAQLNESYFLDGRTRQRYFALQYQFIHDTRDNQRYAVKGNFVRFSIAKYGLGIFKDLNLLSARLNLTHYKNWKEKYFVLANFRAQYSLPKRQPYFNQQALGYAFNSLRAYEYYVIDGQDYAMLRTAFKYKILERSFQNFFGLKEKLRTIPLTIYLKTYGELAYVKDDYFDEDNPLNNTWLASTGIGIDILSLYDLVLSFEYSLNRSGEHGLFFHFVVNYDYWQW